MIDHARAFILGNPRSGTSLFRLMLNNHSNITAPPESGFAHWLLTKYSNWSLMDSLSSRADQFITELIASKKFETWGLSFEYLKDVIKRNMPSNYGDLVALIYLSYSDKITSGQIIVDKNNYYINHIVDLPRIWNNAKYIHLIRDGRDVACSYLDVNMLKTNSPYKPKFSSSIENIAKEWTENNNKIARISEEDNGQYLLVKYENIILDTKNELEKVCDFLGVKFDKKMLTYFKEADQNKIEPSETLEWKLKTRENIDTSKVSRFNRFLTKVQIDEFEFIANNDLRKYGYI